MLSIEVIVLTVVMRYVYVVVPVFLYKIDGLIAGIIAVAVFIPFFGMARWHIEINRLLLNGDRRRHDQNRVWVNQSRPGVISAQVDLTIKTGLANTN